MRIQTKTNEKDAYMNKHYHLFMCTCLFAASRNYRLPVGVSIGALFHLFSNVPVKKNVDKNDIFYSMSFSSSFLHTKQAKNTADYYKKKFENIKKKARQRETLVKKQLQTGGGQLTKAEQRIVQSQAYTDLALKLGISASGNEARGDSDAGSNDPIAPTGRLQNILNTPIGWCYIHFIYKLHKLYFF